MLRFGCAVGALLLQISQPVALGIATGTAVVSVVQAPANAQSAEAVAKIAQAITVRIEGATQGSGVLVKREGSTYTVLTAWHVVAGHVRGEELDIETTDGKRYRLNEGSIQKIGEVDLALLTFNSSSSYDLAEIGDIKGVSMGSTIYVAGFPLSSAAVPIRMLRFLKGEVIANATVAIPNGYQLLYSNPTLPGMSGGVALNSRGELVGIHGQGETDFQMSEQQGIAIKTGTNQAVPISFYVKYFKTQDFVASSSQAQTLDDYLAQVHALLGKKGGERQVIALASRLLSANESDKAYFYRAYAKYNLGDQVGAISDYSKAIAVNPQLAIAYFNRSYIKRELGDKTGAIADLSQVILVDPKYYYAYSDRGNLKSELGDKKGALSDLDKAIAIDPRFPDAYYNRAILKSELGDKQGALSDYNTAIARDPHYAAAYTNRGNLRSESGDKQGALSDFDKALSINQNVENYYNLAMIKYQLGNGLDAIADLGEVILLDSKHSVAYHSRGVIKLELGDNEGAISDLSKAIFIDPEFSDAYISRGIVKSKLNDKQGAISDFSKSISINPLSAISYSNRGIAKFELGDSEGAIADFSLAIAVDPGYAKAYANRGIAKQELGDMQGACFDFKKEVALGSQLGAQWLQSDSAAWCRNMR